MLSSELASLHMRQILRGLAEHSRLTCSSLLRSAALEPASAGSACSDSGRQASLRGLQTATACARADSSTDAATARPAREPDLPPWTPSRERSKRGFLPRRMGHLMQASTAIHTKAAHRLFQAGVDLPLLCPQMLDQEQASKALEQRQLPDFDAGDVLEVRTVGFDGPYPAVYRAQSGAAHLDPAAMSHALFKYSERQVWECQQRFMPVIQAPTWLCMCAVDSAESGPRSCVQGSVYSQVRQRLAHQLQASEPHCQRWCHRAHIPLVSPCLTRNAA